MRKIIVFITLGLLLFSYSTYGQSFKEDFRAAIAAKNMTKAEEILKAWDYTDANDPELYSAYFNFFTIKSLEKDSVNPDKKYVKQALDFISEGIDRFPTRFDMRVGKIYMYFKLKEYNLLTDEIVKMITYSKKIENQWKGEDFTLVEKPDDMLNESVQEFQERLFATSDTTLFKNILRISKTMTENYPKNMQSWLNLSTMYAIQKNYDASLDALSNAEKNNPNDAIILYNIAYIYEIKGDKDNAKKYYEKTVQAVGDKDEKLKTAAQKHINALKK